MTLPGATVGSDIYDRLPVPDGNEAQRRAAVRAVASMSVDAEDCAHLLDVLGLQASEGREGERA